MTTTPNDPALRETLNRAGISVAAWTKFAEAEREQVRAEFAQREQRRGERAQATQALIGRSGSIADRLNAVAAAHWGRA